MKSRKVRRMICSPSGRSDPVRSALKKMGRKRNAMRISRIQRGYVTSFPADTRPDRHTIPCFPFRYCDGVTPYCLRNCSVKLLCPGKERCSAICATERL